MMLPALALLAWHILAPGKFYPGTPHHYAVYTPANLDPLKPAPFMIFLDGHGAIERLHAPAVFDRLIAKGDLPPLIGIFVDPGILPAVSDRAQNRYERIFEYDSLSPRFSRFLLEELIPEVAKSHPLSAAPDDHAIAGVSTGAVGAFVAAWQRPDQFHRVLSLIGTYVDMKGAEELASLVRKTEPKPIRIFMQDGRNDHIVPGQPWGISFAGSWPINNQVMYQALEFAGYDARLEMGEGKHDTTEGAALMPGALRWLWAGYPSPVTVHEPAAMKMAGYEPRGRVYSIISADQPWTPVSVEASSVAGLAANRDGDIAIADPVAGRIYRIDRQGRVGVLREHCQGVRAIRFGADGCLYASQPALRRIMAYDPAGGQRAVLVNVTALDLVLTHGGDLYYFDAAHRAIGLIDTQGRVKPAGQAGNAFMTAGLALSPDQAVLVVADGRSRFSWSLQIAPGGALANGEPFYRLYVPETEPASGARAVAFDILGQVYFAGPLGIQIAEQNGRIAAILNGPEFGPVTGLAFGGPDRKTLYVTDGRRIFRRPVKVPGAAVWSLVKPPLPPL